MTENENLFFHFLRKGLWGKEEREYKGKTPDGQDWEKLIAFGLGQAVMGVITDGISQTCMRPDRGRWEQLVFHLLWMEQVNKRAERDGQEWIEWLEKKGMKGFVFKGTSIGVLYPNPEHRSPGDVDIVLTRGSEKLVEEFIKAGIVWRNENEDLVVEREDMVPVEFHPRWEYVYNPLMDRRLKKLTVKADNCNKELYFVCLVLHIRRHFLTYGIGLKQVCDVAVMLKNGGIDYEKTAGLLRWMHVEKFSRVLFGFIVRHIGGVEEFPLEPIIKGRWVDLFGNLILDEAYKLKRERDEKGKNSRSTAGRILGNAWFWMKRGWMLAGLIPGEAFFFLIYMAKKRTEKLIRKLNG